MDIKKELKTTSDAFTLALQLAVTGTDEAKVKECKEMDNMIKILILMNY